MCLLVLCLMPENLLDPNDSFASFSKRLTISPVVERLVFSKVCPVSDWCPRPWGVQTGCCRRDNRNLVFSEVAPRPSHVTLYSCPISDGCPGVGGARYYWQKDCIFLFMQLIVKCVWVLTPITRCEGMGLSEGIRLSA